LINSEYPNYDQYQPNFSKQEIGIQMAVLIEISSFIPPGSSLNNANLNKTVPPNGNPVELNDNFSVLLRERIYFFSDFCLYESSLTQSKPVKQSFSKNQKK
jgi:hypothetical protein